ncbi:Protein-tyrosine phosphatase [Popillia japonica]|uniref:Protein-tyrosine phosphatase n=1 Tax=Popillia japonica TaxID=7064 RepID=A0AAW1MB27_POPJA
MPLLGRILKFKGGYPARLKKVLIVTAPLWFKAPFKILRLFVREKLRERVFTVSVAQLLSHIRREALPTQLGGLLQLDHNEWLSFCLQSMTTCPESPLPLFDGKTSPSSKRMGGNSDLEISSSTNNVDSSWADEVNVNPPSSASSGFSDDDSLHGDGTAFTMQQLLDYVNDRGRAGLEQEYAEIRARPPDGNFKAAKSKNNLPKNRYTDVLCYDHSRVMLAELNGEPDSDYIHANFVDGYKQKNAFINTQGPLQKTAGDFWKMVWEQHSLVIVMTTRVMERGRPKCLQYWPNDVDGEMTYGDFKIRTISIESNSDYTLSSLILTNLKTEENRDVSHWQFTSWPDYGVPQSAKAMIEFLERVRVQQANMVAALGDVWAGHPRGPPIIVHCSAGIGRTGTFCTLDICISRLEDVGTADIRGTVERIRSQRAYSIQMPDQYVFCHLALIEYALLKGFLSSADLTGFDPTADEDSD